MLRRIVRPVASVLARVPKAMVLNTTRPCFSFATEVESFSKLRNLLESEIKHEEENKEDLTEFTNFFQNQGWKVKYDGTQVELSKKSGLYNLRVLFNARPPMGEDEQPQEGQQQQEEEPDFTEVSAYLQKDGNSKWLALDFVVSNKEAQLTSATFTNDYEAEKAERKKGRAPPTAYSGPELGSLDENLQESIYSFFDASGLNTELLVRAAQFSVAYEHQFYVAWLKDLKSLL